MIYGDFCVMSETQREIMLERIHDALLPEGRFVFDVFTPRYTAATRIQEGWYTAQWDGFWHPGPHLVLQDALEYEHGVLLNRYTVVPAVGRIRTYHLWYRPFERDEIVSLLGKHGFGTVEICGDLTGAPFDDEGAWIGVVAGAGNRRSE